MINAEPDTVSWLRVALAFAVVFGLLALLGFALKYIAARGIKMPGLPGASARRLQVMETLPLDVRRRLVIVRCDGREHLLLLGANQDIVVETDLKTNQTLPPA